MEKPKGPGNVTFATGSAVPILIVVLIVAIALTVVFVVAGPVLADSSPSPSCSPTATPSPLPTYPSAEYVAKVKALRVRVVAVRRTLCRVRDCFGDRAPKPVACLPLRGSQLAEWERVEGRLRHQGADWRGKYRDGRDRMLHPGGPSNGVRWKPLMRWVKWPESCLGNLSYIVMRESSGRERAYNPVIGCSGLLQIWPGNLHAGERASDLFHAEFNLRVGLRLYRECGWQPWSL